MPYGLPAATHTTRVTRAEVLRETPERFVHALAVLDVIYPTFAEHLMASMTWHLYAAGGLFWGLGGWAILSAVMRQWDLRADALAQRPFEFLDRRNPEESEDAPPP